MKKTYTPTDPPVRVLTTSIVFMLAGRYLYAQLRVIPSKYFAVHFDVLTADKFVVRITMSNLFREVKVQGWTLHLPALVKTAKWTVLALDLPALLKVPKRQLSASFDIHIEMDRSI